MNNQAKKRHRELWRSCANRGSKQCLFNKPKETNIVLTTKTCCMCRIYKKSDMPLLKTLGLDDRIQMLVKHAPVVKGYSILEVAKKLDVSWPTARWKLDVLEKQGVLKHTLVGRSKLYCLDDD